MIRRPPRSTQSRSSAASDVYKRHEEPFGTVFPYGCVFGLYYVLSVEMPANHVRRVFNVIRVKDAQFQDVFSNQLFPAVTNRLATDAVDVRQYKLAVV